MIINRAEQAGRRALLLLAVLGMLLASCGGNDDDTSAGEPGAEQTSEPEQAEADADFDPQGTAVIGYDLVSASRGGFSFDPKHQQTMASDLGVYHWVYGALLRPAPDGTLVPDLAESAEVVDEGTIEVQLRDGITLSDGRPFDAELVKAALEANLAAPDTASFAESFFALSGIEVTSPTSLTLTIGDGTAFGWFDKHIGGVETVIVPPGTDFQNPIGAGPFTVASIEGDQKVTLEKNLEYWDADNIKLAGVELVNVSPQGNAAPNAINAGQVDFMRLASKEEADAVSSDVEMLIEPDPTGLATVLWCKAEPPLDDERVRQAMSYAIDREAINEALYDGEGLPAWDVWPEGHRFYNEEWAEHYRYDPEQARQLLEEAGYADGFDIDFIPHQVSMTMAQILQQQWADVGINVNLIQTANYAQDALIDMRAPMTMVPVNPIEGGRIPHWSGDGISNLCDYSDPEVDEIVQQLQTVSASSDEAVELWHQLSDIVNEKVLTLHTAYQPRYNAYDDDKLGGVEIGDYTIVLPDLWQLHVKA